jgi:hypothetical protein
MADVVAGILLWNGRKDVVCNVRQFRRLHTQRVETQLDEWCLSKLEGVLTHPVGKSDLCCM